MITITHWLEQYRPYLNPRKFLAALRERTQTDAADDLGTYFKDLLGPLAELDTSTKLWTRYFADGAAPEQFATTPEGAIDFLTRRLQGTDHLAGEDASTLAEAYFKIGNAAAGELATAVAYLAGDRSPRTASFLAGMAVRAQEPVEARRIIEECRQNHPESRELAFIEATLLVSTGESQQALDLLGTLLQREPDYAAGWKFMLDVLLLEGRAEEAVKQGKEATRRFPADPVFWDRLATAQQQLGKFKLALQALEKALQCTRQSVADDPALQLRLRLGVAQLHERLGDSDQALQHYRDLLQQGHNEALVFLHAAACIQERGQVPAAEELLNQGLRTHPGDGDLQSALGELYFKAGKDQTSFELLQAAAENDPTRSNNLLLMAAICLRNRKYAETIELAAAVARLAPDRAQEALLLVGDAHRFQGNTAAALEVYQAAQELDPDEVAVAERIAALEKSSVES